MLSKDELDKYIKEYKFNVVFDFTNASVGEQFRNYTELLSIYARTAIELGKNLKICISMPYV